MGSDAETEDHFETAYAGVDLQFRPLLLDDPKPTGRQVILAAGLKPADEYIVLQWLKDGDLEELRLDEETDLRERGVERFIIVESDRSYRLELDGERQEWPARFINGLTLKRLAGKDPASVMVFLDRQDTPDREVDDDEVVDLAEDGVEKFRFPAAQKEVEIFVNKKRVKITRGKHTGYEIKEAAIQQGINIKIDFILSLEDRPNHTRIIDDAEKVTVKAGQKYSAVADDDKS